MCVIKGINIKDSNLTILHTECTPPQPTSTWRIATWNTPGYTDTSCKISSCPVSLGSDPSCDNTTLSYLITNLKNTDLVGTDIKTTVTDILYNNMPYNTSINPDGNQKNKKLECSCQCVPGECISFPQTNPYNNSKDGPWVSFYHGNIGTDNCTTNCYPKGGEEWFSSRWKLWKLNLGKMMTLPDPTDSSKNIKAIISHGHGSFGGKCGDIALYKLVSPSGVEGYIINLQNGPRTWSLELSQNSYVNSFTGGHNNDGSYAGIPVGLPLTGMDEYNKEVDPGLDPFDYSSGSPKFKYQIG